MAMNWSAFNAAKASGGGNFKQGRRFVIKDGETVEVRFLVNDNEPFIFKEHYVAQARRYLICAEDAVQENKHTGCVPCFLARTNNKKYKNAARKYAFSLIDSRKFHVLEVEGKKVYKTCTSDESCKYCRKGNEAKSSGVRYWNVNQTVADQIRQFEKESLGKACMCGGRVKVVQYICPECDAELEPEDPLEPTRCFICEKEHGKKKPCMVHAEEVLKCTKCKDPKRVSLANAWVTVTRSGEGTTTTYNLGLAEVAPLGKEYKELKPVEFATHQDFKPVSSGEQAAICNTRNPFTSGPAAEDAPRPKDDDEDPDDIDF